MWIVIDITPQLSLDTHPMDVFLIRRGNHTPSRSKEKDGQRKSIRSSLKL
jgi:hypothetical protein